MKIVSAHIPKSHVRAMEHLVGKDGLYPSRSELVRAAIKEYLIDKLKMIKRAESETSDGDNGAAEEYKIYKIIHKLKF